MLPRKEIQAVKAVLQGTSSQHHQQRRQLLQQHAAQQQEESLRGDVRHKKDDATSPRKDTLTRKRNLFEVFKKPSNAKEAERFRTPEKSYVLDKSEIEYIEALKVLLHLKWKNT